MRLVIAKNLPAMRRIVARSLGEEHKPCKKTLGLVSPLTYERITFRHGAERRARVCDPRYFAAMFLVASRCSTDIVAHECGHAAIHYAQRCPSVTWGGHAKGKDDERICYPLGAIFKAVNLALHQSGVWSG